MPAHYENEHNQLGISEKLSSNPTHQDFACIGHVMDMGISKPELPEHVTGVRCNQREAKDEYDGAKKWSECQ